MVQTSRAPAKRPRATAASEVLIPNQKQKKTHKTKQQQQQQATTYPTVNATNKKKKTPAESTSKCNCSEFMRSGRRGIRRARRKTRAVAQPQWKVAGVCPDTWEAGIGRGSRLLPPQRKGGPFVGCRLAALLLQSGPLASRLAAWSRFLPTYLLATYLPPPPLIGTYPPSPLLLSSDTGAVSQKLLSSANQKLPFSLFSKYPTWCVGSL